MQRFKNTAQAAGVVFLGLLSVVLLSCDADSPTAPTQTPAPPPPPTGGSAVQSITVTAAPNQFQIGVDTSLLSQVVIVASQSNGQPVPGGSTGLLSTTGGELTTTGGSGASVPIVFDTTGTARATLDLSSALAGGIIVRAQIDNRFGQANVTLLDADEIIPLFVESAIPNIGPPDGGTNVELQGAGFLDPVRVTFGGIPADIRSVSSTRIRVQSPAVTLAPGEVRTVDINVTVNVNGEAQASDTLGSGFTYSRDSEVLVPQILNLTPTSGPNEGGTEVTIFGEGFASHVQVFFGTGALIEASLIDVSRTRIVALTPPATGPNATARDSLVDVRVVNVATGASTVRAAAFQYGAPAGELFISTISNGGDGTQLGGEIVTLFGQGFEDPVSVAFVDVGQQINSVTGTEIVVRTVPFDLDTCAAVSGQVQVTNIATGQTTPTGPTWTFFPVEVLITGLSPSVLPQIGGTTIEVFSSFSIPGPFGFVDPVRLTLTVGSEDRVVLGTIDPPQTYNGFLVGGRVTATSPAFPNSVLDEEPCGADGSGMRYIDTPIDLQVTNQSNGCSDTLDGAFLLRPTDTSCRDEVIVPPAPNASFTVSEDDPFAGSATFTDTSTGTIDSYMWEFGDGGTSTLQNPIHSYAAGGSYFVTLTVTNAGGSDTSDPVVVTVSDP